MYVIYKRRVRSRRRFVFIVALTRSVAVAVAIVGLSQIRKKIAICIEHFDLNRARIEILQVLYMDGVMRSWSD